MHALCGSSRASEPCNGRVNRPSHCLENPYLVFAPSASGCHRFLLRLGTCLAASRAAPTLRRRLQGFSHLHTAASRKVFRVLRANEASLWKIALDDCCSPRRALQRWFRVYFWTDPSHRPEDSKMRYCGHPFSRLLSVCTPQDRNGLTCLSHGRPNLFHRGFNLSLGQ